MKQNNIQHISSSFLCSACGACKAICPKDAIEFHFTNIGRLKADINDKCIECGLCKKVCPSLVQIKCNETDVNSYVGNIINTYIGKATNNDIYQNSQSGGVCTAITSFLLESNKVDAVVVCKICPGEKPFPKAMIVRNKEELKKCQRSCYTQLDLLSVFREIDKKNRIALVGIPCEIEGLTLLQETIRKYNVLYKIGLICDRIHCYGYQETILTYSPKSANKIIYWRKKDFSYNHKYYSYENAPVVVCDEKDRTSIFPNQFRFSLKDFFTPPRCRVCRDKLNVFADVVLGDPWGMSDVDWDHGSSVVICRTERGQNLIDEAIQASVISLVPANKEELIRGQQIQIRKESIRKYVDAFCEILPDCNSWLIKKVDITPTESNNAESEKKELMDFCKWERMSKRSIIREGQKKIAFATGIWHPTLLTYRIFRKIKVGVIRFIK